MNCPYCGNLGHVASSCYRVKAIEYHPNGALKRVELHDFMKPQAAPESMPDPNTVEQLENAMKKFCQIRGVKNL